MQILCKFQIFYTVYVFKLILNDILCKFQAHFMQIAFSSLNPASKFVKKIDDIFLKND